MEACVPLVVVCLPAVLAVLAMRWGYDSRDSLPSQEEKLAALGLSWGADTAPPPAHAAGRPPPVSPLTLGLRAES